MRYLSFLQSVHDLLQPEHYLEVGVRWGDSLALARCHAVGIDPAFAISAELNTKVSLLRTTSDEYFARPDPLAITGGKTFDLAFLDGLHLFEFALRDFIYAERYSSPKGVIVFDDVLPRNIAEAARVRTTTAWTGDVYPILAVLAKYRPDLNVIPVGTTPTGLLLITGLDASNTTLSDEYDAIVGEFRHADPQPVPQELLDRLTVAVPQRVLDAGFLTLLAESAQRGTEPGELRRQLAESIESSLGRAFVGTPAAV